MHHANISNVIALCPNDHRKAHYGSEKESLREAFLSAIS